MKKNLPCFLLLSFCMQFAAAQNLISKVPARSALVIKYAGENFTQRMSLKKVDSYKFIRKDLFAALHIDTLTSIENTGINFAEDAYQYYTMDDSTNNFVTLLHIKNISQFVKVLGPAMKTNAVNGSAKMSGYETLVISDNTSIGWNNDVAVVVVSTFKNRENWYTHFYSDTATVAADSTATVEDSTEEVITDTIPDLTTKGPTDVDRVPEKEKITEKSDGHKTKHKHKKEKDDVYDLSKMPPPPPPPPPLIESDTTALNAPIEDMEVKPGTGMKSDESDSLENLKRELFDQRQDMRARTSQHASADSVFENTFHKDFASIKNEESYNSVIDPQGHVTIWLNQSNLLSQYQRMMYGDVYHSMLGNRELISADSTAGLRTGMNIYFEKDRIRLDQKSMSPDSSLQSITRQMMNSRQGTDLAGYINPGNLGFVSLSVNSEATMKYDYAMLKQYFRSQSYMKDYTDLSDAYVDFLELVVDEKALSDLAPGNFLFVLHDMKTKKVDYTDYTYDKEFHSKEVTKSTRELSPDFSFIMSTKNEAFMERLARLPIRHAEKGGYKYYDMGGYYRLAFDSAKNPIDNLYFIVKNGKVVVTTSMDVIRMTMNNTPLPVDAEAVQSALTNNFAAKINSKRILDVVRTQAPTGTYKKLCSFFHDNIGDITMQSVYNGNVIQTTGLLNITGNHANGLEFIFDMIQGISNITETDRREREKHAD